jgi:hypothetical protein
VDGAAAGGVGGVEERRDNGDEGDCGEADPAGGDWKWVVVEGDFVVEWEECHGLRGGVRMATMGEVRS